MSEMRILTAAQAPDFMANDYALQHDPSQPEQIDWNARFSATQRTYIYRILNYCPIDGDWGVPFEWDRSWRIRGHLPMNVAAMREAASILHGTHDFSSFRAARCQRHSPIVTMDSIQVQSEPYGSPGIFRPADARGLLGLGGDASSSSPTLITIQIAGSSFLYHQVRNMVACLADVGKGKLTPSDVKDMLLARERSEGPPGMAPAHGLFLADVRHGSFDL